MSDSPALRRRAPSRINKIEDQAPPKDALPIEYVDGIKAIQVPTGVSVEDINDAVNAQARSDEAIIRFRRVFKYRPHDGANATLNVLERRFGLSIGHTIKTLFGNIDPEMITIETGPHTTRQVPWGHFEVPSLTGAVLDLEEENGTSDGALFAIECRSPRKHQPDIEAFFDEIEQELCEASIYRGAAISGTGNEVEYIDLSTWESEKIILSPPTAQQIDAALFGAIKHADVLAKVGVRPNRKVLLYGPPGTGKTSIAMNAGQVAVAHGWTFIVAKPGEDDVADALATARLYAPALVLLEDIDGAASTTDREEASRLLEAFDGSSSKDRDVIVVATTNHLDVIRKEMLRAGRFDYLIEVGALDSTGIGELIRAFVEPDQLAQDINWAQVTLAMEGFPPSFVATTLKHALSAAVARTGSTDFQLTTDDLRMAARGMRPHLKQMHEASDVLERPSLDGLVEEIVRRVVGSAQISDTDDHYTRYHLVVRDSVNEPTG